MRRELHEVGRAVALAVRDAHAQRRRVLQPLPCCGLGESGAHHVLHESVDAQRGALAVDQREPQQLADGLLHVQLVTLGQRPQHLDGDGVGGEERHRLQHTRGERRAAAQAVEGQPPGGRDRAGVAQQHVLVRPEQPHVVGHRHAGLLDVGARLLQGERQVAEQLGQLPGGVGVRIAAAFHDVGDRLRAVQRRDGDRPGQPPPGLVAGGDDHVAVHRGGQEGLEAGGLVGVVEHEHPARRAVQLGPQRRAGVLLAGVPADAQRDGEVGQRGRGARGVFGGHPPRHPPRPAAAVRELARQLGLARARHAVEDDGRGAVPRVVQRGLDAGGQLGPHDERPGALRQVRPHDGARDGHRHQRVLVQHRLVDAAQRRRGIHPELLGQVAPAGLVGVQGVGLPSGRVERGHQPRRQRFPQGVPLRQPAEQLDVLGAAAQPHVHVGERLGRDHLQLGQPACLRLDRRDVDDACERPLPHPPRQRRLQGHRGLRVGPLGQRPAPLIHLGDERVGVDRPDRTIDDVPAGPLGDRLLAQHRAQPRHLRVDGLRAGALAPDVLDDVLGGDRQAPGDDDPRQHPALDRATEPQRLAVMGGVERPQYAQHGGSHRVSWHP